MGAENQGHSEELFRLAVESAPNSMIMVDQRGKMIMVNAQTERLFGYSRKELLGRSIETLVPERFRSRHPGHREAFFVDPRTRSMGAGRDLYALRKDGSEVPVEIGLNPIQTPEGTFVLAAVVDITERTRAEERFRVAVEAAPSAMLMVDEKGKIVLANAQAEKLFGYPRGELLEQPVELLVPGRFRSKHPSYREGFAADPHSRPMGAGRELFAVRKDGTEVPVEIGLNPIQTGEGRFVLAAVVDLTELKRVQKELVRTQSLAAVGELAASVAHEIRNPLAAISGPLQIIVDGTPKDDPRREIIQEILGQVRRLDRTVRGLMAFSKPWNPKKEPVELRPVVERVARLVGDSDLGRGIRFAFEGGDRVVVALDPSLFEQVFWNLIQNSAQAMKGGGEIRISITPLPEGVGLAIEDTGSGIPADVLSRIFQPFVTTKPGGTGLGLPVCRKIVEAHGGTIEIASEPGRGTTVRLRFPNP